MNFAPTYAPSACHWKDRRVEPRACPMLNPGQPETIMAPVRPSGRQRRRRSRELWMTCWMRLFGVASSTEHIQRGIARSAPRVPPLKGARAG